MTVTNPKISDETHRLLSFPEANAGPGGEDYGWNRIIGWTSLAMGAVSGLVLGLWSFNGPLPSPEWIGDYGEVSRRLLRLAHISFFGLGMLNLLLVWELERSGRAMGARAIPFLMNAGNVLMPILLTAAAIYPPLKYLLPLPALSVLAALAGMAYGVWNHEYRMRGK